jgi:hypothetical protein
MILANVIYSFKIMATVIMIVNYNHTVIMIVNYNPKTFIVQATVDSVAFSDGSEKYTQLVYVCLQMHNLFDHSWYHLGPHISLVKRVG